MSSLRILTDDAAPTATITASTTAGGLVAGNVATNEPAEIWRATSTTAFLTLTLTSSRSVDSVVAGWTNITPSATVTVDLFTNDADSVPVASVTPVVHAAAEGLPVNVAAWFGQPVPCRKLRITVAGNASNVQVGRVMVGARLADIPVKSGVTMAFVDKSSSSRTESGSMRVDAASVHRVASLPIFANDVVAFAALNTMAASGKKKAAFVSLFSASDDPRQQSHAFIGRLADNITQSLVTSTLSESALTFEEI